MTKLIKVFLGLNIEQWVRDALKKEAEKKHYGNVSYLVNEILSNYLKGKK